MIDFSNLLLNGYINEYEYFTEYLLREQKKAENDHYKEKEFFNKCFDVIEKFKEEINRQYYRRKTEIYMMRTLPDFSTDNFNNAMEDLKKENYSVTLYYWSKGRFSGNLGFRNIIDIENKIIEAKESLKSEIQTKTAKKSYLNEDWFKVGLLFATGKMEKYYNAPKNAIKEGYSAPKILKELNLEKGEKYILGTFNNYRTEKNINKNIYASRSKMTKIIDHCKAEDKEVTKEFLDKLPPE